MATLITDNAVEIDATIDAGRVMVSGGALEEALGWEIKPEGLCKDDVCVPLGDDARSADGRVDLAAAAQALQRPVVVDEADGIVAVGMDAEARRRVVNDLHASDFELPDFDGNLHRFHDWTGTKRLLFAWSSW